VYIAGGGLPQARFLMAPVAPPIVLPT
jgi:hypothetical protein